MLSTLTLGILFGVLLTILMYSLVKSFIKNTKLFYLLVGSCTSLFVAIITLAPKSSSFLTELSATYFPHQTTQTTLMLLLALLILLIITFILYRHKNNQLDSVQIYKNSLLSLHNKTIPSPLTLTKTIDTFINNGKTDLTLAIIKVEQVARMSLYIDETQLQQFLSHIQEQLTGKLNKLPALLPLTNKKDKSCFIGPDHFALLVNNNHIAYDIDDIIDTILCAIDQEFSIGCLPLRPSVKIGLADYPEHGNNSQLLLHHAILACQHSPQNNKGYFSPNFIDHAPATLQLAQDLKVAIDEQKLVLFHQPQIDLKTNKVCSSECLLRWQHSTLGYIKPENIIAIAEDFNFISALTQWVLTTAIQQQLTLFELTGFNHTVSINISKKDLLHNEFVDNVKEIIEHFQIKAEKLIFEISQPISIANDQQAIYNLNALTKLGIKISINDFISCYHVVNMNEIPIHELKLDPTLINHYGSNKQQDMKTKTAIRFAKDIKLEVVAQGIKDEDAEAKLKQLGCDIGQSYFYAKPMHFDDYCHWLQQLNNSQIPESVSGEFISAKNK